MSDLRGISSFFSRLSKNTVNTQKSPRSTSNKPSQLQPTNKRSKTQLQATLRKKLLSIDIDTELGFNKARRIYFETSLAWEFGDTILLDPATHDLVDTMMKDFLNNPQIKKEFDTIIKNIKQ